MWDWINKDNADIVVAWATIAGVLVALLAAMFALSQLGMIRKDSRERTRPYVQLDVVPGLHGAGSWDLIIENRGASTALQVIIDAGEFTPQDGEDHISPIIGDYLLTPKTLVPGARRRVMWGLSHPERNIKAGVLAPREVKVSYLDERKVRRRWPKAHPYNDTFEVGDAFGAAVFPAPTEGALPNNKDMLAHIDRALRAMNGHIAELRR